MNRFQEILVFRRVAESANVTQAARTLGMAQSSVSRLIAALERRLDARLLARSSRGVALTEAGKLFYSACGDLLGRLDAAEAAVRGERAALSGRLTIAAPSLFYAEVLAPILHELALRHDALEIDVRLDVRALDLVAGGIDLAIRIGPLDDGELVARRLGEIEVGLYAAPAYLASAGPLAGPDAVAHHACLGSNYAADHAWALNDAEGRSVRIAVRPRLRCDHLQGTLAMAVAGAGLAMLPHWAAAASVGAGRLARVLPAWRAPGRPVRAVWLPAASVTARQRAAIDLLAARVPAVLAAAAAHRLDGATGRPKGEPHG